MSVLYWVVVASVLLTFALLAGVFLHGCVMLARKRLRAGILRILLSFALGALLSFVVLILTFGDPAFVLEGVVQDETGAPVEGATVALECTPGFLYPSTVTNQAGGFGTGGIGYHPDTCPVIVRAPGYTSLSMPIGNHCVERPWDLRHACLHVALHAKLRRAALTTR